MDKVSVEINTQLNEVFSKSIITQKFSNNSQNSIELKIDIYKIPTQIFSSFKVKIGESKIITSKVMKKEKAEQKYTDSISSGNSAICVNEESEKYVINIRNIPSKEKVIFISEFLQFTEYTKNFEFELLRNLPIFQSVKSIYQNTDLTGKVEIQTKYKIINIDKNILMENLKIIEEKYKNEDKNIYLITYQVDVLPTFNNNNKDYLPSCKIYFNIDKDNAIIIYNQKSVYDKNKNYYALQYINKIQTQNNEESLYINPALLIFLVDQSGSMSGLKIKIASQTLELFLHSLPVNSYYQIIGFGSTYIKYDEKPKEYTQKNVKESLEKLKNLEGNLCGTNIYEPLDDIYNNYQIYENINLPKNIIVLTDGVVENKNNTLKLVEKMSSKFSIFSIGIGIDFDKDLVKSMGVLGKGNYTFCENIDNLKSIFGQQIKDIFCSYNLDLSIKSSIDDKNLIKNDLIYNTVRKNQILNVNYITDLKEDKINIEIKFRDNQNKNYEKKYEIIPKEILEGDELSKLIINKYLLNNKELNDEEKVKLALKYQLLTKDTSLFAEVELCEKAIGEMKLEIVDTVNESKIKEINKKEIIELNNNHELKMVELNGELNLKKIEMMKKKHEEQIGKIVIEKETMKLEREKMEYELRDKEQYKRNDIQKIESEIKLEKEMDKRKIDNECFQLKFDIERKKKDIEIENKRESINDLNEMEKKHLYEKVFNELIGNCEKPKVINQPCPYPCPYAQQNPQYFQNQMTQINNQFPIFQQQPQTIFYQQQPQTIFYQPQPQPLYVDQPQIELNKKKDIMKIIYNQDLIEGFWEENEMTNLIKEKYIKEYDLLKGLKNITINYRVAMTIIMIYFINKEHSNLLKELSLIIMKAKIYINKETKFTYENIIKEILNKKL